ncbi:MAG: hypothetical protein ACTSUC_09615 [Promethearchaeota archaeon]
MAAPKQAWYDKAFISVSPVNANEVELRSKTTSINVSGGNFDIEGIETFGGKITRIGPREDIEISFDGIPTKVGDFDWLAAGGTSSAATSSTASSVDTKYRITFLWTNQAGVTSATQAITGSNQGYRNIYAEALCTGIEKSMDAGDRLKATLTFKLAPEDTGGSQNYKWESKGTASGTMNATPAYTDTAKF